MSWEATLAERKEKSWIANLTKGIFNAKSAQEVWHSM